MNPDQMKAQMKIFKAGYPALTGAPVITPRAANTYILCKKSLAAASRSVVPTL